MHWQQHRSKKKWTPSPSPNMVFAQTTYTNCERDKKPHATMIKQQSKKRSAQLLVSNQCMTQNSIYIEKSANSIMMCGQTIVWFAQKSIENKTQATACTRKHTHTHTFCVQCILSKPNFIRVQQMVDRWLYAILCIMEISLKKSISMFICSVAFWNDYFHFYYSFCSHVLYYQTNINRKITHNLTGKW